jgi:phage gp16-like protein
MPLSRRQLALIHVAKAKLALSDEDYRRVLVHVGGVESSAELDGPGFDAVMGFLERLGFRPLDKTGPDYGARPGMASFAQLEMIRALWVEWSGARVEDGLETWLKRKFKVDSLRFLTAGDARRVITALKAMKAAKARAPAA